MFATFDYHSYTSFFESCVPSLKYAITKPLLYLSLSYPALVAVINWLFPAIDATFGMDGGAFIALIIAFIAELISGIIASHIRGEQFSSLKLSRFTFKVFYYLVIIFVPYRFMVSFKAHDSWLMAVFFDWLHVFLIAQIVLENLVSILENMSVIYGNDKTTWINSIKNKLKNFIG